MSFDEMQRALVSEDAEGRPLTAAFEDPRVVGAFSASEVADRTEPSSAFSPANELPEGKGLLRTLLREELPAPRENETRMALWLFKYTSPNEGDVWDWVCSVRNGNPAPGNPKEQRYLSELFGAAYKVDNMQPYVCFTTDMEAAHTVARIGCSCDYDDPVACALLCLVDVPNEMPELGAEAPAEGGAQPEQAPPDTLACCGLLQRPFEPFYYRKVGGDSPVVGANYQTDRLFACKTYAGNMRKYGYKVVHTTQIFMQASVAASKMHPLCFYSYKQSDVLDKTGEWQVIL